MKGLNSQSRAYIISDVYGQIADAIMELHGPGGYQPGCQGHVLGPGEEDAFSVWFPRKKFVQIREIVAEFDPKAFVIVS